VISIPPITTASQLALNAPFLFLGLDATKFFLVAVQFASPSSDFTLLPLHTIIILTVPIYLMSAASRTFSRILSIGGKFL